jgi:DNA-binding NarL/FixJ family response regulator
MQDGKKAIIKANRDSDVNRTDILQLKKVLQLFNLEIETSNALLSSLDGHYHYYFIEAPSTASWRDMLPQELLTLASKAQVVIFNARAQVICPELALMANVRGVLNANDGVEIQLRAIERIMQGELWFTRSVLSKGFLSLLAKQVRKPSMELAKRQVDLLTKLTNRERTVIKMISQGAQNQEIANQLHISGHTVKTHIYSAFRKTNSRNRIELANWAQRHLPQVN